MKLDNIKVGDKFSTEQKLLTATRCEKTTNSEQKKRQLRDLCRYLTYEKTGKLSRGKVTNEIIITEIFDTPKPKIDLRCNNGGNSTSVISDYIKYRLEKMLSHNRVEGSQSAIIRELGLVDKNFTSNIFNLDNKQYTTIEQDFISDFYYAVMTSYKQRLKRVIGKIVEQYKCIYHEYYQICTVDKDNLHEVETISNTQTIKKITKFRENLEYTYGVTKSTDKWKIYNDKKKYKQFKDEFVQSINRLLKRKDIINCYKIIFLQAKQPPKNNIKQGFTDKQFYEAQAEFTSHKIQTVFNKKVSHYFKEINGKPINDFVKVDKYRVNSVRPYVVALCQNMINCGGVESTEQMNMPEEKPFDESMLTNAQHEQVELGLKTLDDFKPYYD